MVLRHAREAFRTLARVTRACFRWETMSASMKNDMSASLSFFGLIYLRSNTLLSHDLGAFSDQIHDLLKYENVLSNQKCC